MSKATDEAADRVMLEIWEKWFNFYNRHFRKDGVAISAADQMAFYEIAQPKLRALAAKQDTPQ